METEKTAGSKDRRTLERSPRFPFISLERALERAAQFYAQEKRGSAPFGAVAEHWGYKPTTSGALQTVAALKSYGLIEGGSKNMRLSELAIRILLDKRPDSIERDSAKRQAALSPAIAKAINDRWPDGLPSDATLNHHLVLELGFNEATAEKALSIIKENQSLISNLQSHVGAVQSETDATMNGPEIMQGSTDKTDERAAIQKKSVAAETSKVWTERTNDTNGLNIVLQVLGEPTEDTFSYLQDFVAFKLAQLRKKAKDDRGGN